MSLKPLSHALQLPLIDHLSIYSTLERFKIQTPGRRINVDVGCVPINRQETPAPADAPRQIPGKCGGLGPPGSGIHMPWERQQPSHPAPPSAGLILLYAPRSASYAYAYNVHLHPYPYLLQSGAEPAWLRTHPHSAYQCRCQAGSCLWLRRKESRRLGIFRSIQLVTRPMASSAQYLGR